MTTAQHYYEAHVTVEPVFNDVREGATVTAQQYGFKLAKLLMQKRIVDAPERSKYDTFMTAHGVNLEDITNRTKDLVTALQAAGLNVWRYKIEDTILDSRIKDELGLLERSHGNDKS